MIDAGKPEVSVRKTAQRHDRIVGGQDTRSDIFE